MKPEGIGDLEEQVAQFNERLVGMAHYYQQTCAFLVTNRMSLDMEKLTRPPKQRQSLFTRLGAWVRDQITTQRTPAVDEEKTLSIDEHLTIIDTTYRVLAPDEPEDRCAVYIKGK